MGETRKKQQLMGELKHLPYLKVGNAHFMRVDVTYKGKIFFQMIPNLFHGATYGGSPLGDGPFTGILVGDDMEYFNRPELMFSETPKNTSFYSEEQERKKEAEFWTFFHKKAWDILVLARQSIVPDLARLRLGEAYRDFLMYMGAKRLIEQSQV